MKALTRLTILTTILLTAISALSQNPDAETAAARAPLEHYLKGLQTGAPEFMRKAFYSEGQMTSINRGNYSSTTFEKFIAGMGEKPSPEEVNSSKFWVESVEVTGTVAVGKTILDFPGVKFTDYMTMLKIDGEWKIVNKSFHAEQKTKTPDEEVETVAARVPLENYLKGLQTGNPEFMRKAFYTEGKMSPIRGGKYTSSTFEQFIAGTEKPSLDEAKAKVRIESVEVTGTVAVGKLILDLPTVKFTDYMTMLKINGEWKIVNKSCHAQQNRKNSK